MARLDELEWVGGGDFPEDDETPIVLHCAVLPMASAWTTVERFNEARQNERLAVDDGTVIRGIDGWHCPECERYHPYDMVLASLSPESAQE